MLISVLIDFDRGLRRITGVFLLLLISCFEATGRGVEVERELDGSLFVSF